MKTITRSIRLTARELAWILAITEATGAPSQSEAIRSIIYFGLDVATTGKWLNQDPAPRFMEQAEHHFTKQGGHSRDAFHTLQGLRNLYGSTMGGVTSGQDQSQAQAPPLMELTQEDIGPRKRFARTEEERIQESHAERAAAENLAAGDPITADRILDAESMCWRDPSDEALYLEACKQVAIRARYIKANYGEHLSEKETILIDKIIGEAKAEKWI